MGRPEREDFAGAWHHVTNRGARRSPIFRKDEHCGLFLNILTEACGRYRVELHAYALMSNHYHLLLRSPHASLSRTMAYLGSEYTRAINRIHKWDGPVFTSRFASQLIDDRQHLLTAFAYIHLNPVRAGLIRRVDQAYWTSHRAYLEKDTPPEWLYRDTLLPLVGGPEGLVDLVRDLKVGRRPWPEDLDLNSGFFDLPTDEPKKKRPIQDRRARKVMAPAVVIKRVQALTGANASDLKRTERGRGANPARRFAAWALCKDAMLTYTQIGKLLAMSPVQVGHTVRALRHRMPQKVQIWADAWERKFSI